MECNYKHSCYLFRQLIDNEKSLLETQEFIHPLTSTKAEPAGIWSYNMIRFHQKNNNPTEKLAQEEEYVQASGTTGMEGGNKII